MKKLTYIQPETKTAVMPKYALMGFQNSPTEDQYNPAPGRQRTPVF